VGGNVVPPVTADVFVVCATLALDSGFADELPGCVGAVSFAAVLVVVAVLVVAVALCVVFSSLAGLPASQAVNATPASKNRLACRTRCEARSGVRGAMVMSRIIAGCSGV
jgi:hypothetical protein